MGDAVVEEFGLELVPVEAIGFLCCDGAEGSGARVNPTFSTILNPSPACE